MTQLSESNVTVHQLPQELLDKPLNKRFELALQHWLDLYPGTTELRFGRDHASDRIFMAANLYGPRLDVMSEKELHKCDSEKHRYREAHQHREEMAQKQGVALKDWMSSDPSVELFYDEQQQWLQYNFRKELAVAINYALAEVNCYTHRVQLSDHDDEYNALHNKYWGEDSEEDASEEVRAKTNALVDQHATLVWQKKDKFTTDFPPSTAIDAVTKFFADFPNHPVLTHVKLGETIEVAKLDDSKWAPMEQTASERVFMQARQDLSNPEHPWMKERTKQQSENDLLYAYIASQYPTPIVRNGRLLYQGRRFDSASDTGVGYVVVGTESCGTVGINRDAEQLMEDASRGQLAQTQLQHSHLPDVLVSMAYHTQVVAHQKERAAWLQQNPVQYPAGQGPLMPKAVKDLQVGDTIGVSSFDSGAVDLWCKVTKREGDVATLFIHNGHWDFELDTATNTSLPRDIVKNFAGQARVVYTAPMLFTDGAAYNEALQFMNEHMEKEGANAAPSL